MFCAYTRPRYQVSVYRTISPLVSPCLLFDIYWTKKILVYFASSRNITAMTSFSDASKLCCNQQKFKQKGKTI